MNAIAHAAFFAAWAATASATEPWGDPHDALLDVPGVTVTERVGENGEARQTFALPGGVEITQFNRNAPETVSTDRSGAGAVLCFWDMLAAVHPVIEGCMDTFNESDVNEVARQLDRIETFALRNSHGIVTAESIAGRKAQHRDRMERRINANLCSVGSPLTTFARRLLGETPGALAATVDALLEFDRYPARNPCL